MQGRKYRWSVCALLMAAGAAVGQPLVSIPLGDLGGATGAAALGLNDAFEVVGYSDTQSGAQHAFFWSGGVMQDLGVLQGGTFSRANAINNLSQIVGTADDSTGRERAVMWTRDAQGWQIQDLGTLSGGLSAAANAISDGGYIVGRSSRTSGPQHAFIYFSGAMTDLGVLSYPPTMGTSEALGVDSTGRAVGYAYSPLSGPDHAWFFDGTTQIDITPPGQFTFAHAVAINSQGQIACSGVVPGGGSNGSESAIYTTDHGWVELGIVAGYGENEALAINNNGQVVGRMLSDLTQTNSAYFYGRGGMQLLTDYAAISGELTEATGISNTNGITANFIDAFGNSQAFLIRPDAVICYANCDRSTAAPVLNANDFQCFLNQFAGGDPQANCDLSTAEPILNANDFQCFLNKFAAGCT